MGRKALKLGNMPQNKEGKFVKKHFQNIFLFNTNPKENQQAQESKTGLNQHNFESNNHNTLKRSLHSKYSSQSSMSIHSTARFQHSLALSVTCSALCDGQQVIDSNDGHQVTVL